MLGREEARGREEKRREGGGWVRWSEEAEQEEGREMVMMQTRVKNKKESARGTMARKVCTDKNSCGDSKTGSIVT